MAARVLLYHDTKLLRGTVLKCLEMICSSFVYFTNVSEDRINGSKSFCASKFGNVAVISTPGSLLFKNCKLDKILNLDIPQIPDPNFFHPGYRIHIKELKYFKPKNCSLSSRKWSGSWFFTHPGSRCQKGTGSWIRNTASKTRWGIAKTYFREEKNTYSRKKGVEVELWAFDEIWK